MWRALVFTGLLCVAAFGAVWLAERPGSLVITFAGYEVRTTVAVAVVAVVGIAVALAMLWSAVSMLLRLPARVTFASRARRRARGFRAVSRGMIAVGAGDAIAARRFAGEAERLIGEEPLALLLKAQAAQASGNRTAAETAFSRMMENPETRVLGLRGLFVEARRRGDAAAARQNAVEAARLAPAATWASDAVLEGLCTERDWRGALAHVERRAALGLLDKSALRRHRAVLLTADALDRAERDPHGALSAALEALKSAPDLVPAAALAGRLLSHRGDLRRAARIVEAAWKEKPHPELAEVYLNLRPGDSARDRLKRAETLAKLSSWAPEARMALARAAMEAREFARARSTLEPLAVERPSVRVCLMMADLEQMEHGAAGRSREWLARATRAPRDPAWIADGLVSARWAPMSPVTGRLDAFVWQTPPDLLVAPEMPPIADDVTGDLDDTLKALPRVRSAPEESSVAPPPAEPVTGAPTVTAAEPDHRHDAEEIPEPAPDAAPGAKPDGSPVSPAPAEALPRVKALEMPATPEPPDESAESKPRSNGAGAAETAPVVFPIERAPDDPGAESAEEKPSRLRLFR